MPQILLSYTHAIGLCKVGTTVCRKLQLLRELSKALGTIPDLGSSSLCSFVNTYAEMAFFPPTSGLKVCYRNMRYLGMILLKYKLFSPHIGVFQKHNLKNHNTPHDKLKVELQGSLFSPII